MKKLPVKPDWIVALYAIWNGAEFNDLPDKMQCWKQVKKEPAETNEISYTIK
jgi:hypothetical protein